MGDEPDEVGGSEPEDAANGEREYPRAPGASKMEALRRIERSLEDQSERTPEREGDADARKGDETPVNDDAGSEGDPGA